MFDSVLILKVCFALVYLYGLAVQGESSMKRPVQQAHGISVEEKRRDQCDVLRPGPGLQHAHGQLLHFPSHVVQNHVKPERANTDCHTNTERLNSISFLITLHIVAVLFKVFALEKYVFYLQSQGRIYTKFLLWGRGER